MSEDDFESAEFPAWARYGLAIMTARQELGTPPDPITWDYASRALQVARGVQQQFGTPVRDVVADLVDHGQSGLSRARSDIRMAVYALRMGCPASLSVPVAAVGPIVRSDLPKSARLRLMLELDAMGRSRRSEVTLVDARRLVARALVDSGHSSESGEAE